MATFLIALLWVKCIVGEISLDIGNGETSDFHTIACKSSYCSNTTIFSFNGDKTCYNPLLTIHFRLTDFSDTKLQYLTITLNQQELGKCTGPNNATFHANYDVSSIPLYTDCLNDFTIAELVGYNPTKITLKLSISPHVTNIDRIYNNNLLYSKVAFGCSDQKSNRITSQEWDPSLPVPAHSNLQCIQSGCQARAHFVVLEPEKCRVPLLSLQFWLTDFDQDYEYLTVEVNGEYLGICEGGKQMELNSNLLTAEEEDKYWNNYSYWCFREIDISRYSGLQPEEIEIRLTIQDTVDRNVLDASATPYLLDAIVKMDCGERTQDEIVPNAVEYDRRRRANDYPYPDEIQIVCQEVECGGVWDWTVLGHCEYPVLNLYYYAEHYEDSMMQILINEKVFGHCGPTDDTGGNVTLATQYGTQNVRTCFEGLEFHELLGVGWNSRHDFNGNPDAISNSFKFGFALTEIDELDGIVNGSVARLFVNLNCLTKTSISNNAIVHVSDSKKDVNGFPYGESEMNCVYAGCSSKLTFEMDVGFLECEIPKLDLWFWLTDFGIQNEFLSVTINNHLYGWCDGGRDDYFKDGIYQCLDKADVEEWADWDIHGNKLELMLNASTFVDGLDANKNGFLVNAKARLTCYNRAHDTKISKIDVYPNDSNRKQVVLPVECQGVGCFTYSIFYIRQHICYQPKLSVKFWLSDFSTFDEYVSVEINGQEMDKCRGGSDRDFEDIWTCFSNREIRYMLFDYAYNNNEDDDDFSQYYIAMNDVLNISLQMSEDSLWLDHSRNHSILQGTVTLRCEEDNNPIIIQVAGEPTVTSMHNEDINDFDNDTFRFIELSININKVTSDIIFRYSDELQSRFEYSLDASIHFEDDKSDQIPFTIQSKVTVIDPKQVSDFQIYITTLSHSDAQEILQILEMDIFLFIFQETLRDSHFKDSVLESINNIEIITDIPQSKWDNIKLTSVAPNDDVKSSVVNNNGGNSEEIAPIRDSKSDNFFKILFTSASATDWLSFIGVIALCILMCACCIGGIGFICIHQQRNKTRKEIQKYKQTNQGDSDSDIDEMRGMINQLDDDNEEPSVISHESHSMKSFLSKNSHKSVSVYHNDGISEKIKMISKANDLKDKVERHHHHSQSGGIHSHKKHKSKRKSKDTHTHMHSNDNRRSSQSYSHSIVSQSHNSHIINQQIIDINRKEIQMSESPSKSTAIHPALSTAIETVNKMNTLKSERIAATHGLVVSSSIIEASSESESPPSGIDLSEEFVNIDDDIEVSIDINDIDDMNDIRRKQHKRNTSKRKKFKSNQYSSIQEDDHDDEEEELSISLSDKVFGMQIVDERKEQALDKFKKEKKGHKRNKSSQVTMFKLSDQDSDDLSDLSDSGLREQSLNSLTQEFSQMI